MIFRPKTLIGWQRAGFRMFWGWKSRRRIGRPEKDQELIQLIRRMWSANPIWGSPRIRDDLAKLGLVASTATSAHDSCTVGHGRKIHAQFPLDSSSMGVCLKETNGPRTRLPDCLTTPRVRMDASSVPIDFLPPTAVVPSLAHDDGFGAAAARASARSGGFISCAFWATNTTVGSSGVQALSPDSSVLLEALFRQFSCN
jgi:hypothetical protein